MSVEPFIDWQKATQEQRQALYRTVKALIDSGKTSWNAIASALPRDPGGATYFDNFRMGRNSRRDCEIIYLFLKHSFPESAADFARMIDTPAHWLDFVQRNRTLRSLDLRSFDTRYGVWTEGVPDPQVWSGARATADRQFPLHLRVQGGHNGAVALSSPYGVSDWRPLTLRSSGEPGLIVSVVQGEQLIWCNAFEHNGWLGLVQLVLITGVTGILRDWSEGWNPEVKLEVAQLRSLTDALSNHAPALWTLHQVNFAVVP